MEGHRPPIPAVEAVNDFGIRLFSCNSSVVKDYLTTEKKSVVKDFLTTEKKKMNCSEFPNG